MAVIVDTSVLIADEHGTFDLDGYLAAIDASDVAIAAITASELLHGVERTKDPIARADSANRTENVFDEFQVVPFGLAEARVHARIWAALARQGKMIGAHDLIIAATALAHDASVATLNPKDFKRVSGLTLEPVAKFVKK